MKDSERNIPLQAVDQYEFLDHRRQQEKRHWQNLRKGQPLDSILTVEINATEHVCFVQDMTRLYILTETCIYL